MAKRMKGRFFLYSSFNHCMLEDMLRCSFCQSATALLGVKQRIVIYLSLHQGLNIINNLVGQKRNPIFLSFG